MTTFIIIGLIVALTYAFREYTPGEVFPIASEDGSGKVYYGITWKVYGVTIRDFTHFKYRVDAEWVLSNALQPTTPIDLIHFKVKTGRGEFILDKSEGHKSFFEQICYQ